MDATQALVNLYDALQSAWPAFVSASFLAGAVIILKALMTLADGWDEGGAGRVGPGGVFVQCCLGGGLLALPELISLGGQSLVMESLPGQALSFQAKAGAPVLKAALNFALALIKLVGAMAIAKGLGKIRNATISRQPEQHADGMTLCGAGLLAVFFPQLLRLLANTTGGAFSDFVSATIL